ncbi:efflux RND transporter periplasmic adaptor subunit [Teichococcus deserti]|uniref:efflux RND transporter periplasmic adaptor subunit n=1 Tax=Teichococcus deserti TaxID=1817963 RepID=UPI001F61959D|nr:efflux RND transporter periplasmic adaptor subunit [Pseudoroseomonas deserti]
MALAGCDDPPPETPPIRPVRVVTAERGPAEAPFSLAGQVQAQDEVALAFRHDGRLAERAVEIGQRVAAGQVVARLEPQNERNALQAARARAVAAAAALTQARGAYGRQSSLLASGFTTRAQYEQAEQALATAQSQQDAAAAELRIAEDRLDDTELRADAPGLVVARGAEVGEVVRAGQPVLQIARQDGRDAVFDVPAALLRRASIELEVSVALADDPGVQASGRVREVAPQADAATGTFRVRVGLTAPPPAMRLGAAVIGRVTLPGEAAIKLPASALVARDGQAAVWVVDPASGAVALRGVEVARHTAAAVVIAAGLQGGETVVAAGAQALHPGQRVRLP